MTTTTNRPSGRRPSILEIHEVSKHFGEGASEVHALRDLSLQVGAGEFVALMGPSGCGKSTLLHLAGALDTPTSGTIRVDGQDLSTLDAKQRAALRRTVVGFVFQKLNLIVSLTALENVMLPLEVDGLGRREARAQAEAALAAVDLPPPWDRFPDDFSGGQQQRIAIARATVGERKLILADEPTGALDTVNADQVIELLASVALTTGAAIVLVTHEPRFASWADRVVFLRDGQVVDQTGSVTAAGQEPPDDARALTGARS
jgi:putative ABC transport system ATP-binding protein